MPKTTLILGASMNTKRYAHIAAERLLDRGHPLLLIGKRAGSIEGIPILTSIPDGVEVDTVTLYLNPVDQELWHERLLALRPRRIIFNPGTEHHGFMQRARTEKVEVVQGCTLVMLSTGQY